MPLGIHKLSLLGSFVEKCTPLRNTCSCLARALHNHRQAWESEPLELQSASAQLKLEQKAVGRTEGMGGNCTFNSILDFS